MASLLGYQIRDEQSMGFVRVLGQPADVSWLGSPGGTGEPGRAAEGGYPGTTPRSNIGKFCD